MHTMIETKTFARKEAKTYFVCRSFVELITNRRDALYLPAEADQEISLFFKFRMNGKTQQVKYSPDSESTI